MAGIVAQTKNGVLSLLISCCELMNLCEQQTIHSLHYVKFSANFGNNFLSQKNYKIYSNFSRQLLPNLEIVTFSKANRGKYLSSIFLGKKFDTNGSLAAPSGGTKIFSKVKTRVERAGTQ